MNIALAHGDKQEARMRMQTLHDTMQDLFLKNDRIVSVSADMMRGFFLNEFKESDPDRIINCGIAEANMMGVSAGLSVEGYIPFAHAFAAFACRRMYDQIYMSGAYARQNVKIIASDPGICAQLNGGTHNAQEDIAAISAIPGMTVVDPADSVALDAVLRMVADTYGMFYIRLSRVTDRAIYEEGARFAFGKAYKLRDGKDCAIFAEGIEVAEALRAAESLENSGIHAAVYDIFTIKPLDESAVIEAAKETGAIVVAENGTVRGGVGSAIAEVVAKNRPVPMEFIGNQDEFGEVGTMEWLKERFGLASADIEKAVKRAISRK